jgi:hypothetical protein
MARDLTSAFISEITAGGLAPIGLIRAYFDSGTLNLWTGIGDLVYNGVTYIGIISILSISEVQETKNLQANGLNIQLSGLDETILDIAEDEPYSGRSLEFYMACLDSSGNVVADPYLFFEGFMDVMKWKDDGRTITIDVSVENVLISLERALDTKYTPEDQKRDYPTDTFFDFIADIQNKEVTWG